MSVIVTLDILLYIYSCTLFHFEFSIEMSTLNVTFLNGLHLHIQNELKIDVKYLLSKQSKIYFEIFR